MTRRCSDEERQKAKTVAQAILSDRMSLLEGVRALSSLADSDAIANEADRNLIVGINSDTDHLPMGEVRKHWAEDALKIKDAEIAKAEARWGSRVRQLCQSIAAG